MADQKPRFTPHIPGYSLELTKRCNNNCLYCYNAWKRVSNYSTDEMSNQETKDIIDKLKSETRCYYVILSGGEPLLREDILDIISHAKKRGYPVTMITNGTLLADEKLAAACIEAGVCTFEITLLSHRPEVHNYLVQNDAWSNAVKGIRNVKKLGGRVALTFIATEINIPDIEETYKLSISLGADELVLNRINVAGEAVRHINELMPDVISLYYALGIANWYGWKYGYKISSTIPIQPCVIYPDPSLFRHVTSNCCSIGTEYGSYVIDPAGFVRPCSLSSLILGDFKSRPMVEILNSPALAEYVDPTPAVCEGCVSLSTCRGGCRAAAESCYGSHRKEDPFMRISRSLIRQRSIFPERLRH